MAYSRAGHDLLNTSWWHDHLTREPNIYNAIYYHKRVLRVALFLTSCLFHLHHIGPFHPRLLYFYYRSYILTTHRHYFAMSAGFHIPVPVDVGLFLKQKAGTPLSEVKRPPNVWVIFRSCAVHNWPKALGPKPKNVMKVSRLLQPVWEALQNSRRFQAWQLFSLRVTNAHNMRFPNYKFNPAKKGTKVSRKPKKLKDRKASLRGSGSKANDKLSSHEKISTETSQLFSLPVQPETPSVIPTLPEDGGDKCIVDCQPWQHWQQCEPSQGSKYEQNNNYGEDFAEDVSLHT